MGILETKNVSLSINGNKILNDVDMEVEDGQVCALVGPNGAGKSSLAFAIMSLGGYQDVKGDIIYKGGSLKGLSVYERSKRGISLAWQEPARYEGLSVEKFINAAAGEGSDETVRSAIEKVGMDPDNYLGRAVDTGLSGGERKKIELASILVMEPALVLLDEPDSGIDVESLDRIFEGVELLREKDSTIVLITHSAAALKQAEFAYLMCCGTIIDEGPVEKVSEYFEEKCIPCDHKNEPE